MSAATGRELLDRAPAALFVLGLDGTVLEHNEGLRAWLGEEDTPAEGLRGRNIVEWLTPASRLLYETQIMPRLRETGRLREVMLEVRDGARKRHAALINARLRKTDSGTEVAYVAAVGTTARAAFEKELVEARRAVDVAHRHLVLLQDATSALAVANGLDDLGETLVEAAGRATAAAWTAVRLVDPTDFATVPVRQWGAPPTGVELGSRPAAGEQRVCRDAAEIAEMLPQDAVALRDAGVEALVVTPITRAQEGHLVVLGEIHCWFRRARSLDAHELETLRSIAAQAERVVDHLRLRDRLHHHALHDGLTGLPNRTLFEDRLVRMLEQSARDGEPSAVLFLDLDGFKAINDRLGHAVGDEVLRTVAARLEGACRVSDTVARLGGDEFLIAAHGLDGSTVAALAERVREAIREPQNGIPPELPLSASVGAVHWIPEAGASSASAAELIASADDAMYEAKRAGKNAVRVVGWPA